MKDLLALGAVHDGAFHFPIRFPRLDILPFVELHFPLPDRERDFYLAVLPIECEREKGVALDTRQAEKLADF